MWEMKTLHSFPESQSSTGKWESEPSLSVQRCKGWITEPGHSSTASSALWASLLETLPAWDLFCCHYSKHPLKYWEICHWFSQSSIYLWQNSKCFTFANLIVFLLQFTWPDGFYSSDLEYSAGLWKYKLEKCAHLHNQVSFQELEGHRLQWTFCSENILGVVFFLTEIIWQYNFSDKMYLKHLQLYF